MFSEQASGANDDRPILAKALRTTRRRGATLVVARLDRLARSLRKLLDIMGGVPFICVDMPEANEHLLKIMGVVAEIERKLISQRTKDALAIKKAEGAKLGGYRAEFPPLDKAAWDKSLAIRRQHSDAFIRDSLEVIEEKRSQGYTTMQEIADQLTIDGTDTPRMATRRRNKLPVPEMAWRRTTVQTVLSKARTRGIKAPEPLDAD